MALFMAEMTKATGSCKMEGGRAGGWWDWWVALWLGNGRSVRRGALKARRDASCIGCGNQGCARLGQTPVRPLLDPGLTPRGLTLGQAKATSPSDLSDTWNLATAGRALHFLLVVGAGSSAWRRGAYETTSGLTLGSSREGQGVES